MFEILGREDSDKKTTVLYSVLGSKGKCSSFSVTVTRYTCPLWWGLAIISCPKQKHIRVSVCLYDCRPSPSVSRWPRMEVGMAKCKPNPKLPSPSCSAGKSYAQLADSWDRATGAACSQPWIMTACPGETHQEEYVFKLCPSRCLVSPRKAKCSTDLCTSG